MSKRGKFFSEEDLKRAKFGWRTKMWLWILPTHTHIQDGLVIYFKRWRGKFYLINFEKESNCSKRPRISDLFPE